MLSRRRQSILTVTLNRPDRLNALDADMRARLCSILSEASGDGRVGAVVLTGAGERAFCAGQDLNESAALSGTAGAGWMHTWRDFFEGVSACRKPLVAAINGVAAGAGLQLALLADIRMAVPDARLLMAEVNVGLPAIVGSCLLTQHLGHSRASELVLTGRPVPASEARRWGLVHDLIAPKDLLSRASEAAQELADKPPVAMRLTLGNLRRALRAELAETEQAAQSYQTEAIATGEPQEAMARFLSARASTQERESTKTRI